MAPDYKWQHRAGLHAGGSNPACTLCTQESTAASLKASHAVGLHAKLPRQTCPDCRAARAAQWAKPQVLEA